MKGRIIGREGRNIRALEHLTGVDVIIDDTPQAVVLSSFDGIRREIAKLTLSKLIEDGRIHPARIEEMYYQSKAEIEEHILQAGEQAVFEANCGDLHEELVKILGRLRFRTSYGQNVLKHTLEVVHLAGIMAAELGERQDGAARGAPARPRQGADPRDRGLARAPLGAVRPPYGESQAVVHAIEAHHYEVEPQTVEAVLLIAADAISAPARARAARASRTTSSGSRRWRSVAARHEGVEKVYAIQAGREIRVIVKPNEVDDDAAVLLSHEIAREIEDQLEYPGQIKVTVIRERGRSSSRSRRGGSEHAGLRTHPRARPRDYLAGCGSKSPKDQFVSELNGMCEDFAAREQQIGEPHTQEDLAARGDRIVTAFEQTILGPLQQVEAPPAIAPQAAQLRVLARQQRDVLRGLAEAGRAGDVTKVGQLSARNTTLNAQAGRIAHDLEADSCAS